MNEIHIEKIEASAERMVVILKTAVRLFIYSIVLIALVFYFMLHDSPWLGVTTWLTVMATYRYMTKLEREACEMARKILEQYKS